MTYEPTNHERAMNLLLDVDALLAMTAKDALLEGDTGLTSTVERVSVLVARAFNELNAPDNTPELV